MSAILSPAADIFGLAAAGALLSALVLAWLGLSVLRGKPGPHFVLPWAIAFGFIAGYGALPRDFAPLAPDRARSWTWLPWAGLFAAVVGSAIPPGGRMQFWRYSVVAVALPAAIYLTPSWPAFGLEPKSQRWLLTAYLLVIGVPLQAMPNRMHRHVAVGIYAAIAIVLAGTIGGLVSLKYAQLAAIAGGAFLGAWIAAAIFSRSDGAISLSVIPVYTVLSGGISWIACVEPDPPQATMLAVGLLPLLLWVGFGSVRVWR